MVYTVTFNPSLDYITEVKDFKLGRTNRTGFEMILPGGKGINVSIVLKNLGIENTALGFVAGFTGRYIENTLENMDINTEFIELESGISRINMKIRNIDGTEINGKGPDISKKKMEELFLRLEKLKKGDVLVLAGSIPQSVPEDIYETILGKIKEKEVLAVVDASGYLLLNVLKYHPFLIKPNHHELGEIFGVTVTDRKQALKYAALLQKQGAENILVSMGKDGAVLLTSDGKTYEADAPEGQCKNSVGAGDSMVAGFMAGYMENKDFGLALRKAVAAGSASTFSDFLATADEICRVEKKVNIFMKNI